MAFFLPFIGCYTTGKKTAYHYIVQNELKGELFADGVSFQKNGRYNEAIEAYTRLLKDYPDESKAHYNLGMIYAYKVVNNKLALEKSAGKIFAEWLSDKSAKSYHDSRFKCSKKIVLDINWNSGI
ncbi:MAG: tetratricopeptide repeat protein [Deltaproteobacteria bacterium]|nr:tetratricopeptide repeat protein [Deltaproteobacteria bacterium]